ncbi:MAG: hypothetical protein IPJ97_07905 [Proteobacteria bacterium]|nr:hypothetical protein [Pseudomonadota bacterium]
MEQPRKSITGERRREFEGYLSIITLVGCAGIVLYKLLLTRRINVNWDEFWFLSFVHTMLRNELMPLLQSAYTHLFTWLPLVGANEVDQVVAARMVMLALLGLTAWLIWRLSALFFDGFAAVAPPFVYLTMIPVMMHGGSFRSDSLLAPLLMTATLLLAAPGRSRRNDVLAGGAIGLAAAVTVKILLFAPMLLVLILTVRRGNDAAGRNGIALPLRSMLRVGAAATIAACIVIAAHAVSISGSDHTAASAIQSESLTRFAARTASVTVFEPGLFPRGRFLTIYANWQPLPWLLIALGAITAAYRRRFDLLALALAMLPITFYRNAYPYFYVVMLAPASVLVGHSIATVSEYVESKGPIFARQIFTLVLALGLAYQGLLPAARFLQDTQSNQREIVAGVHEIFPDPVNYIDRCGMISSYRKANFFMSSWGITEYKATGTPVMQAIAQDAKPAFVIMNVSALATTRPSDHGLLEVDRIFLQRSYSRYWGPIKVAGGTGELSTDRPGSIDIPFAADYRVETPVPVQIDGVVRRPGEVFAVTGRVAISPVAGYEPAKPTAIRLVLASARPPPPQEPPREEIFTGL